MEQCVCEHAIEMQDVRELGLGWAWFVNDLRAFLPAWQDMESQTLFSPLIYALTAIPCLFLRQRDRIQHRSSSLASILVATPIAGSSGGVPP